MDVLSRRNLQNGLQREFFSVLVVLLKRFSPSLTSFLYIRHGTLRHCASYSRIDEHCLNMCLTPLSGKQSVAPRADTLGVHFGVSCTGKFSRSDFSLPPSN